MLRLNKDRANANNCYFDSTVLFDLISTECWDDGQWDKLAGVLRAFMIGCSRSSGNVKLEYKAGIVAQQAVKAVYRLPIDGRRIEFVVVVAETTSLKHLDQRSANT